MKQRDEGCVCVGGGVLKKQRGVSVKSAGK